MHKAWLIIGLLFLGLNAETVSAEDIKLTTGETLTGEVLLDSATDAGVQVKIGEGQYQRVPWASFPQEKLREYAKNKKVEPFVEPFIEITAEERAQKTEVNIKQPPRLDRPATQSVVGAMFSSGLGALIMLLLYAANLYAAYEISIFRAQSVGLVCGVSAVVPVIGPIIFLSIPTKLPLREAGWQDSAPEPPAAEEAALNPMLDESAQHPTGLKLHTETDTGRPAAAIPETATFQRGQFTFNRRFFETRFPQFFGVVRRDTDRDMVLTVKTSRGMFIAERISRIAANDMHLMVQKGHASEEVMVPFIEVQEIQLKHKDAP